MGFGSSLGILGLVKGVEGMLWSIGEFSGLREWGLSGSREWGT